jgi:hypothetical protein
MMQLLARIGLLVVLLCFVLSGAAAKPLTYVLVGSSFW